MVKPPVCDVWSGRLQESNHVGGGGSPYLRRGVDTRFLGRKFIACNFLVTI